MSGLYKLNSPKGVQLLLREHALRPRKRWGQNFLCDENTLDNIIAEADFNSNDAVLEIGGGLGALSQKIAALVSDLVVIELDSKLLPILFKVLNAYSNYEIINEDALDLNWSEFFPDRSTFKCLGNLPYYITAPLLEKLIGHRERIEVAIWMMQLEVAEKITSKPGTRESSSLGVFVQSYCDVEAIMKVSKNAFYPRPDVDSAVVRISPLEMPRFNAQPETFNKVVRAAYGMRRKTILKALSLAPEMSLQKSELAELLSSAQIEVSRRGENLTIDEFDQIALRLDELQGI